MTFSPTAANDPELSQEKKDNMAKIFTNDTELYKNVPTPAYDNVIKFLVGNIETTKANNVLQVYTGDILDDPSLFFPTLMDELVPTPSNSKVSETDPVTKTNTE